MQVTKIDVRQPTPSVTLTANQSAAGVASETRQPSGQKGVLSETTPEGNSFIYGGKLLRRLDGIIYLLSMAITELTLIEINENDVTMPVIYSVNKASKTFDCNLSDTDSYT